MQGNLSTTQVDRLGERLRKAPLSEDDIKQLEAYRRTFGDAYEIVVRQIRDRLGLEPTGRPSKSTSSIIEKLRRETIRLSQIQDIAGCRLVVAGIPDQDRIVASLRDAFPSASLVDRRVKPTWGYRAVHVIVSVERKLVEIQVRTTLQHLWAELSEKFSDKVGVDLKYGGGDPQLRDLLLARSEFVSRMEEIQRKASTLWTALPDEVKSEVDGLMRETAESLAELKVIAGKLRGGRE